MRQYSIVVALIALCACDLRPHVQSTLHVHETASVTVPLETPMHDQAATCASACAQTDALTRLRCLAKCPGAIQEARTCSPENRPPLAVCSETARDYELVRDGNCDQTRAITRNVTACSEEKHMTATAVVVSIGLGALLLVLLTPLAQ